MMGAGADMSSACHSYISDAPRLTVAGWLFLLAVLVSAGLLFTMVYFVSSLPFPASRPTDIFIQIIMFSDLECDYINPIDLCNKLNQVRVPHPSIRMVLTHLP
jgi:protein cornichon